MISTETISINENVKMRKVAKSSKNNSDRLFYWLVNHLFA